MLRAARVGVDQGMFVPARTLAVAAARMGEQGIDAVQLQFLRLAQCINGSGRITDHTDER